MNIPLSIFTFLFALSLSARSQTPSLDSLRQIFQKAKVIPLANGENSVDINGDRNDDLVFMTRRENYNAHGYSQYSFFINHSDSTSDAKKSMWHLVPFEERNHDQRDNLRTVEAADGNLEDIRVISLPFRGSLTVIVGQRQFGQSYADSEYVKFTIYELHQNEKGMPGWPTFFFEEECDVDGNTKHIDINEAFMSELGIAGYSSKSEDK